MSLCRCGKPRYRNHEVTDACLTPEDQFGEWRSVLERAATGLGKLLHAHPDWCLCGACKPVSTPAPPTLSG